MKYFGTDGIRGIVGENLNEKLIKKIGKGVANYYQTHGLKKKIVIGNDGRGSADYILSTLASILLRSGIEIDNIGLTSTPCLAYTTRKFNYPLGVMISASHNPKEFNGIKFFNSLGEKISETVEIELETLFEKTPKIENFSIIKNEEKLKQDYIRHLKDLKNFDLPILFDCANGGVSQICKKIFKHNQKFSACPNGNNINENCGCTHIEKLRSHCIKQQKIGFAFDGDADRISIVDTDGSVYAGDEILYIFSKFFLRSGNVVVGSIYTNSELERKLALNNIKLIRSKVGDKNIYLDMTTNLSTLGGEESGHIIVKHYTNTGDGILNAILIGNILSLSKMTLKEILNGYKKDFQLKENLKLTKPYVENIKLSKKIEILQRKNIRVIVRPSGTEPLLRIFVEAKTEKMCKTAYDEIVKLIDV